MNFPAGLILLMEIPLYLSTSCVILGVGCFYYSMISTKDMTTRHILPFLKRQDIFKLLGSKAGSKAGSKTGLNTSNTSVR
ncbi:hypothetical protein BJX99DRAFT_227879 [Aspergillus californicus]